MSSIRGFSRAVTRATVRGGTAQMTRKQAATSSSLSVTSPFFDVAFSRTAEHRWQSQMDMQRRSMVMVTKTKSSELPSQEEPEVSPSESFEISDYNVLSDVLTVTPSCLARVERLVQQRREKDGSVSFLRVYVDAGGCSGFQYQFEFDEEIDSDEDIVVVSAANEEARVVVDETSLGFLEGATLDFVQEMIRSAFVVVDNPKSEAACGCGSSFAVKNFAANPALD